VYWFLLNLLNGKVLICYRRAQIRISVPKYGIFNLKGGAIQSTILFGGDVLQHAKHAGTREGLGASPKKICKNRC